MEFINQGCYSPLIDAIESDMHHLAVHIPYLQLTTSLFATGLAIAFSIFATSLSITVSS